MRSKREKENKNNGITETSKQIYKYMIFLIIWSKYKIGWIGSLCFEAKVWTAEWDYENIMITDTKIVYAEQQALKPQMGVSSAWAAVWSTLFSFFPLLQEGRNLLLVIICISLEGFCSSICSTLHDVAAGLLRQQCCTCSSVFCIWDSLVVTAAAELEPELSASSCQAN